MDTWLHDEILDGLSQLLCLSLERTPAADLIAGTAAMWVKTLSAGMAWERERDTPRIRQAFVTLAQTRTHWPAPLHFREALPEVEVKALGYDVKPVSREESLAILARLQRELGEPLGGTDPDAEERAPRAPGVLAAAEAELRRDRKSAAAGDVS